MQIIKTSRKIGKTLKNAARLKTIVSVFAKHGFHNVIERLNLGKFLFDRINFSEEVNRFTTAERLRMAFEELGPTFVKLGQLLSSRPDLIPDDLAVEFSKLQDNVKPISTEEIEIILKREFGDQLNSIYSYIDMKPIGAASIAQVHKATLSDGTPVVLKIQRPEIVQLIRDDLNVLYFLADLIEKYVPEARPYKPIEIVNEYFKTLSLI